MNATGSVIVGSKADAVVTPLADARALGVNDPPRYWILRSVAWMDQHWDPQTALLWYPDRTRGYSRLVPGPIHIVRETVWYAVGLLARDQPGDLDRAIRILTVLEEYQFVAPGQDHHGTFCRYPKEQAVPPSPEEWKHYDPNWREFVGLTLLLILEEYSNRLPAALVSRLEIMLFRAADGSAIRGVPPIYTNVALMSAALMEAAGRRNSRPDWIAAGEALAQGIYDRFAVTGVVDEFNSPTYYGVSLGALAHYRRPGASPVLNRIGAIIEAAFWRDMGHFYHHGLRNLCGPYDRAYGVDMLECISAASIWIALVVEPAEAPIPDFDHAFDQLHDACFTPYFAVLGANCSAQVRQALTTIPDGRFVEQEVTQDPLRVATAWLGERLMLGGQRAEAGRPATGQVFPATLHWKTLEGKLGWICVRSPHFVDAVASENRLAITVRRAESVTESLHASFEISIPKGHGCDGVAFDPKTWNLPGLRVEITSEAKVMNVDVLGGRFVLRYAGDGDLLTFTLRARVI